VGEQPYDYGLWWMVAFNVLLFGAFVVALLRPRRSVEWRTLGVFSAFIVALFAEMYGFPLTVYFLSGILGWSLGTATPFGHLEGHLLATLFSLPVWTSLFICLLGGLATAAEDLVESHEIHEGVANALGGWKGSSSVRAAT